MGTDKCLSKDLQGPCRNKRKWSLEESLSLQAPLNPHGLNSTIYDFKIKIASTDENEPQLVRISKSKHQIQITNYFTYETFQLQNIKYENFKEKKNRIIKIS